MREVFVVIDAWSANPDATVLEVFSTSEAAIAFVDSENTDDEQRGSVGGRNLHIVKKTMQEPDVKIEDGWSGTCPTCGTTVKEVAAS